MSRPRKYPKVIKKICPTCNNEFEISSRKLKQIYCSKKCSNSNPKVIKKIEEAKQKTFNFKYNGKHPMQTEDTKQKFNSKMVSLYGVKWFGKSKLHSIKTKKTKKERYGDENYNNVEKIKETCRKKYGVENISNFEPIKIKRIQSQLQEHYKFLIEFCEKENLCPLFDINSYNGYHFSQTYKFKCEKCNHKFENTVYNLNNLFCEKCDPNRKNTIENSLFDYLTKEFPNLIIKRRDRTILYGKEIDFYIKDKKIGIEINGLYWHSETGGNHKKLYHINKTKGCLFYGVQLIHIFENELRDNEKIIKSILNIKLYHPSVKKIHARKCKIKEVSVSEKNSFLNDNHLQGCDKSSIKLGLYQNDELVSLMTFRKTSRFNSNVEWELMRYCSKLNTVVNGGAKKIFSHFVETYQPQSILSYSDRRYFDGNLYSSLGFKFIDNTPPSYFYISKDYKYLMNRMNWQKHLLKNKLPNYDETLTEWENMKNNGYDRIWDCGHSKWIYKSTK